MPFLLQIHAPIQPRPHVASPDLIIWNREAVLIPISRIGSGHLIPIIQIGSAHLIPVIGIGSGYLIPIIQIGSAELIPISRIDWVV